MNGTATSEFQFFFFQAEDGIRDYKVTGVQTCALPICSRAAHFFFAHVFYGGHVNGGYLHFLGSFLVDIPVGTWTDDAAAAAAALVRRCETTMVGEEREVLEEEIETLVSEALGLTELERVAIAEWAANDPNWQARERVRPPHTAIQPAAPGGVKTRKSRIPTL